MMRASMRCVASANANTNLHRSCRPGAPCAGLYKRHERMVSVLKTQIKAAEAADSRKDAAAAVAAWDAVEEVSQKLSRLDILLSECVTEFDFLERDERDEDLSRREFDL